MMFQLGSAGFWFGIREKGQEVKKIEIERSENRNKRESCRRYKEEEREKERGEKERETKAQQEERIWFTKRKRSGVRVVI